MYSTVVNLHKINPTLTKQLYSYLLFEFKDSMTLKIVKDVLNEFMPGDYNVVAWADKKSAGIDADFLVLMEFKNKEEYVEWIMKCS